MNTEADYLYLQGLLEVILSEKQAHIAEGCTSQPLCPGVDGGAHLKAAVAVTGSSALILAGLTMVAASREEVAIERALRRDVAVALELAGERADAAQAERDRVLARNEDLQRRLATVEAELTAWEEAADVIGPTGLPD